MAKPPCDALVFFGATGDLAYKKIFPALYSMARRGVLTVPVVGVAKQGWSVEQLRGRARESVEAHAKGAPVDRAALEAVLGALSYVDGDYEAPATFRELRQQLRGAQRPLHYLAIPPSLFATVVKGLGDAGCAAGARVVIEKPFGRSAQTAKALDAVVHGVFAEEDVFRIDHFLGKEAVQNLVYLRFANALFERLLHRDAVRTVQITMAESFGIQARGRFYEEVGALRDVVQNHLLQVLACVAMDPPVNDSAEALRDEKARLLRSVRALNPDEVVRGQFRGYRDEAGVAKDSTVETFVALRLWIDSWRWAGVPFLVRAGKSMPVDATEVFIELKNPPHEVFPEGIPPRASYLRFRLGPDVAIALGARVKVPGEANRGQGTELQLVRNPGEDLLPYERLLGDALHGDATLFARDDVVREQWRIVEPALGCNRVHIYEPGTWGPLECNKTVEGFDLWHDPEPAARS